MERSAHVFIANAVASNLGYVLSRVCVLHETHAGLMGPVMTKAISIETALLASLPADGLERLSAAPLSPRSLQHKQGRRQTREFFLVRDNQVINIHSSNWLFEHQSNNQQQPQVIQM